MLHLVGGKITTRCTSYFQYTADMMNTQTSQACINQHPSHSPSIAAVTCLRDTPTTAGTFQRHCCTPQQAIGDHLVCELHRQSGCITTHYCVCPFSAATGHSCWGDATTAENTRCQTACAATAFSIDRTRPAASSPHVMRHNKHQ
jgi:hypothetical protein